MGRDLRKRGPGISKTWGPTYPGPHLENGAGKEIADAPPRPAVRAGASNFDRAPENSGPRSPWCERYLEQRNHGKDADSAPSVPLSPLRAS